MDFGHFSCFYGLASVRALLAPPSAADPAGAAEDPFLRLALKRAESLTEAERKFLLQYFFQANIKNLVNRYPRYAELYQNRTRPYSVQDFRDLQVLSQLAWFDEFFLTGDPEVADVPDPAAPPITLPPPLLRQRSTITSSAAR